jgi:zinc D-Ala-D-Ala carboxypeptidase
MLVIALDYTCFVYTCIMSGRKKLIIVAVIFLLVLTAIVLFRSQRAAAPAVQQTVSDSPSTSKTPTAPEPATSQAQTFNKQLYSRDDPSSLWVVVNKGRPLPSSYTPTDLVAPTLGGGQLRKDAAAALDNLNRSAIQAGYSVKIISAYRSFSSQTSVYSGYVSRDGQAQADAYSARPGYSEHQTGWAVDVGNKNGNCDLETCFGSTALGQWIAAHAHEYGFIVRYPQGQPTGYQYEPWHLRYVGVDLAKQLHSTNQTMEAFFGLPAVTNYPG